MLARYSAALSGNLQMFRVIEGDGIIHVVPIQSRSASGQLKATIPLMDLTVSIPPQERTAGALLVEICSVLQQKSRTSVIMGAVPASLLASRQTKLGSSDESARSLLDRILRELRTPDGPPLSWQLFNDPGLHMYVLNIHPVVVAPISSK